jgi:hypothetical protein
VEELTGDLRSDTGIECWRYILKSLSALYAFPGACTAFFSFLVIVRTGISRLRGAYLVVEELTGDFPRDM